MSDHTAPRREPLYAFIRLSLGSPDLAVSVPVVVFQAPPGRYGRLWMTSEQRATYAGLTRRARHFDLEIRRDH